ncbi:MAG: hypothetical protein WA672_09065 [Candidatus Angelobacter sp.]
MAKEITAFIARSFAKDDEAQLKPLIDFLKAFEPLGFRCQSAQPAEAEQVSQKIQKLIRESDVFIGMFTRKYPVYPLAGNEGEAAKWTAPSWVLQESGYALGNNKKMMFFVEPGVELPQLQGDFEYIEYDVKSREKAFQRAGEMISKIIAGAFAIQVETVVKREEQAPPPDLASVEPEKPEASIAFSFAAADEALHRGEDSAANEAFEKALLFIRKNKPKEEVFWKSCYQAERAAAGYSDSLSNLKKLEAEYPESHEPIYFYAECQEIFENPRGASEGYLRAAQKTKGSQRSTMIIRAAEALHKCAAYEEANRLLLNELNEATEEKRLAVLSKLYENLKLSNRPYEAFAVGEYSIFENGAQPDLHFNIGFDCGEAAFNELAIFHYKAVLDQRLQDSAALNNLGVAYAALNLPIASVQKHTFAAELGHTLSAGNLAYKYLDAGMVPEATKTIRQALTEPDHDVKVDEAATDIKKRLEAEQEKEKSITAIANLHRAFFREFGSAIISHEVGDIEGVWTFPFGEIPLSVKEGSVTGSVEKQQRKSHLAMLAGTKGDTRKKSYTLMGSLNGRICDYSLIVDPDVENLNSTPSSEHGYVVFSKEGNRASCLMLEPTTKVFAAEKKGPSIPRKGIAEPK